MRQDGMPSPPVRFAPPRGPPPYGQPAHFKEQAVRLKLHVHAADHNGNQGVHKGCGRRAGVAQGRPWWAACAGLEGKVE